MFIFLFSLLEKEGKDLRTVEIEGFEERKYFRISKETGNKVEEDRNVLIYIRNQIHHLGDNPFTRGLVSEKPIDRDDINYYTA